jgi:hypothetical protein
MSIAQHAQPTVKHAHKTLRIVSHAVANTFTISLALQNVRKNGSAISNSSAKNVQMIPSNFALSH